MPRAQLIEPPNEKQRKKTTRRSRNGNEDLAKIFEDLEVVALKKADIIPITDDIRNHSH